MNDFDEILERLRNGETVESIGNNFAKMLNNAKSQYDQEEKERKNRLAIKHQKLTKIIDSLADWYDTYVQELNEDVNPSELADEVIKILDIVDDININNTLNKVYNYKCANLENNADLKHLVDIFLGQ